jgi:hypothetical protein
MKIRIIQLRNIIQEMVHLFGPSRNKAPPYTLDRAMHRRNYMT